MSFRILSLGGGGYLGLFTASVLAHLEQHILKGSVRDHFDLICGTSIGGIIAVGLAKGIPAPELVDLFVKKGQHIFRKKPLYRVLPEVVANAVIPKYGQQGVRETFASPLGDWTLKKLYDDHNVRLSVSSVNLTQNRPHDFKTPFHEAFYRDQDVSLMDVCLATSAAPSFFPTHQIVMPDDNGRQVAQLFCDGGVYANTPDFVGLFDATVRLGRAVEEVSMLSIGTPFALPRQLTHRPTWDGTLRWVGPLKLPALFTHLQEHNSVAVMRQVLGNRYHRVRFKYDARHTLPIDDPSPKMQALLLGMAEDASKGIPLSSIT